MPAYTLITDRGGHLHNALQLIQQLGEKPEHLISSFGPDIEALHREAAFQTVRIHALPELFSWVGKQRIPNPFKILFQFFRAALLALRLRPRIVVSLGASNVVPFCYAARLLGARVYHVECMNQVVSPSITGRMLYPICTKLYVQWQSLLGSYGSKAEYAGWVL